MALSFTEDLRKYRESCYPNSRLAIVFLRAVIAHPAVIAVMWYRFGNWVYRLRFPIVKQILSILYWIGFPSVRLLTGVQILPQTQIGSGLALFHYGSSVFNPKSVIGKNCAFFHNVTLAADSDLSCPTIEDNVMIGTNVVIFGGVTVGHDTMIGAGAVVTKDIPAWSIAGGVPAKVIRDRSNRGTPNSL
jgi:serine O-acetyltransferase